MREKQHMFKLIVFLIKFQSVYLYIWIKDNSYTGWGKSRLMVVSTWNTLFILVLFFINVLFFIQIIVNLLLSHPILYNKS